jgi:hypothetical protein
MAGWFQVFLIVAVILEALLIAGFAELAVRNRRTAERAQQHLARIKDELAEVDAALDRALGLEP